MGYISSFDLILLKILPFHKKKNARIDIIFVPFIFEQKIFSIKYLELEKTKINSGNILYQPTNPYIEY